MSAYEFSEHAREMLRERNILEAWVERVLEEPEITEWKVTLPSGDWSVWRKVSAGRSQSGGSATTYCDRLFWSQA